MKSKGQRTPIRVTEFTWLYADSKRALLVVHEARQKDGAYIQTDQIRIPWRIIDRARKIAKPSPAREASRSATGRSEA